MDNLQYFAWPGSALTFGLTALLLFRKEFAAFIGRAKSISATGITAESELVAQQSAKQVTDITTTKIHPLLQSFDSPALLDRENILREQVNSLKIDEGEKQTILIRHLAACQLANTCETVYRIIYGSQISLLKVLNNHPVDRKEADGFVEEILSKIPGITDEKDFNVYYDFLLRFELIAKAENQFIITPMGREFLTWIIRYGVSEFKAG